MDRATVVRRLAEHAPELQRLGVRSLSLFGSVARDEASEESDVDLLVEFEGDPTFQGYLNLEEYLADLLNGRVDLVTVGSLRPAFRAIVERDRYDVPGPAAVS